jgi:ABC-type glycerol-3-phosphate transport system permease component
MPSQLKFRLNSQFLLWCFLLTLLIIVTIPIFWAVLGGFKTNMEISNHPFALPKTWSFDNFIGAWEFGNFKTYSWNSAVITIGGMAVVVLTACPAGYAFAQLRFRMRDPLFYVFLLGLALPAQAIIIPLFYHMKSMGLINTHTGVVLASAAMALPFSVFLMRNTMRDIPPEMRESAFADGAGEWRTYFSIILPIAKPGVVALLVFTFMNIWNDFMIPLVLLVTNNKFTLSLGLLSFQSELLSDYGLVFGGTVISMIPSIIVFLIFQRQFVEGMSEGAVK